MLEAIHCYEEGVASVDDIDTAIKLGLNHPMGPFEMMDMSGLDTFPHVTETLESLPVTTWKCPESVKKLVAEGKFGRKSGEGWHKYNCPPEGRPRISPVRRRGRTRAPALDPVKDCVLRERLFLAVLLARQKKPGSEIWIQRPGLWKDLHTFLSGLAGRGANMIERTV